MATLRKNIFANLAGGAWIAVLTLVITPLQINLLGMDAYGLIGFIMMLQIVVSALDLGLSSTITRELAGDKSPGCQASRPLLRTAITYYWGVASLICIVLFAGADEVGRIWFNATANQTEITLALQVMAFVIALRWPVALYAGALAGVHRMDVSNLVKAGMATIRLLGGIVILLLWRDLVAFLLWTAVSALVEVFVYVLVCRAVMSEMDWRPGFSLKSLQAVWNFSLSMNGLALLAMGITQLDRVLISKVLPLESLGYYSLAYSTATAISLVLSSLSTALMPAYAAAHASNAREILLKRYGSANRITLFATGLVLFPLLFFGEPILRIWVNSTAAAGAWRALALLAVGFWLSAAVSNAYTAGVACRQPGALLKISAISAFVYVPVLYVMISLWGIDGAAGAWLLLNLSYVLVIIPTVHRHILNIPVVEWYFDILLPFAMLGVCAFGGARLVASCLQLGQDFELLMILPALILYLLASYWLFRDVIRAGLGKMFQRAQTIR